MGKQYARGAVRGRHATFRESITNALRHPFRRFRQPQSSPFWALRDASFDIYPGQVVGLIGRNGSGKSTTLKLLSRITEPTTGRIELYGRIGSLLEVGTGFHPELTGRENIYLNGAILGMNRAEIDRHFDEILEFSEIGPALDTPVKRYSSGMYMRLAFSVAAHLETEILVVDEVLAVGDAAFQNKCVDKMLGIAQSGRTIIVVSHNMSTIRRLCNRAIVLHCGKIVCDSVPAAEAIETYADLVPTGDATWVRERDGNGRSHHEVAANGITPPLLFKSLTVAVTGEQPNCRLILSVEIQSTRKHAHSMIDFDIQDNVGTSIGQICPNGVAPTIPYSPGPQLLQVVVELPPLVPGNYRLTAWMGPYNTETFDCIRTGPTFTIEGSPLPGRTYPHTPDHGYFVAPSRLTIMEAAEQLASSKGNFYGSKSSCGRYQDETVVS